MVRRIFIRVRAHQFEGRVSCILPKYLNVQISVDCLMFICHFHVRHVHENGFSGDWNLPNLVFRYRKIAIPLTRLNVVRGCYTYATFMRIIRAGSLRSVGMDVGGRLQRAGAPESGGSHSRDPPQAPEILRRTQPPRGGHQGLPQVPL